MEIPNVTWDEIDRAEAAMAVWARRWNLPLNPEDCEAIAAIAVVAAKSNWSRAQVYEAAEDAIDQHEDQLGCERSPRIVEKPERS